MSNLRFSDSYSVLLGVGRRGGVHLPWYGKESNMKKTAHLFYEVSVAIFIAFKVSCSSFACFTNEKLEDKIFCMAVLFFIIISGLLLIFYTICGRDFQDLIANSDKLTFRISQCGLGHQDRFAKLLQIDSKRLKDFARVMEASSVICPLFFCLSVPVLGIIDGNYSERVALPMKCPFEKNKPGVYEIVLFMQYLSLVIPSLVKLGHECIMIALFRIHRSYFKYLALAMRKIGNDIATSNSFSPDKFYVWLKLHQDVLKSSETLVEFYSPVTFMYFLSMAGIIAGGVLYQLQAKDANVIQSQFLGAYMGIIMFRLYLQCHTAEDLTTEAGKEAFETYSIPWYNLDQLHKKMIRFVICMSNRPLHVEAYRAPGFRLNRESFQAALARVQETSSADRRPGMDGRTLQRKRKDRNITSLPEGTLSMKYKVF